MKSPAFQFYPADYLADMKVRMLSWPSRGLYIDLLCYCWREGWIPSDSSAIAQLCQCHDTAIIEPCLALFSPHPNEPEKLIHLRLDHEREKQKAFSLERKASGIRGAAKRWAADSSAIKEPIAKNGSSSSSSSSSKKKRGTLDEMLAFCLEIGLPPSDAESTFHKWEGNGWINGTKPIKDWKATIRSWKAAGYMPSQKTGQMPTPAPGTATIGGRIFKP